MASPREPDRRPTGRGRMPRNRARLLVVLTFVAILVVVFGYMLLVSGSA